MTQTLLSAGDGISSTRAGWSFGGETPNKFAAHIAKSVPHYAAGHQLVEQISDYFIKKDSVAYEIGCSTGTLVNSLARRHPTSSRWVGLDVEEDMIRYAREEHARNNGCENIEYLVGDACDIDYQPSDFIVAYYTVQFISPRRRQDLIDRIFEALNWGGAFLMFEKVRAPDALLLLEGRGLAQARQVGRCGHNHRRYLTAMSIDLFMRKYGWDPLLITERELCGPSRPQSIFGLGRASLQPGPEEFRACVATRKGESIDKIRDDFNQWSIR